MASAQEGRARRRRQSAAANLILKEGFLCKKGGVIKSWSRRYFVLNHQCLCYFKRELNGTEDAGLQPMGRVFLSDIVNIETEGVEKKKAFVFALHTKKRGVLLQASNDEDKVKWVEAVRHALESDSKAERDDPFRKTLRRLKPGGICMNARLVWGVYKEMHKHTIAATFVSSVQNYLDDRELIQSHLARHSPAVLNA